MWLVSYDTMFTQVEFLQLPGQHTQKEQVVSQVQLSYHAHTVQQYTVTAFPSLPLNVCVPLQQALITLVYSDELFLLRK